MGKNLCKDQKEGLIAKLTAFFKGLSSEEIDDVVTEAKRQVTVESVEEKKKNFGQLFDSQLETLKGRGCPQAILETFQKQRDKIIANAKAIQTNIAKGNIPFLPVVPKIYLGVYGLMPMVRNGEKVGYTYLNPNELSDVVKTPKTPYYIFDVEDGKAMLGKLPNDAEKIIKKQNRSCLTDAEVIAIGVHTDVLSNHYLDATGSRYTSGKVPNLYLDDGKPKLYWSYDDDSDALRGSASCGSRA